MKRGRIWLVTLDPAAGIDSFSRRFQRGDRNARRPARHHGRGLRAWARLRRCTKRTPALERPARSAATNSAPSIPEPGRVKRLESVPESIMDVVLATILE